MVLEQNENLLIQIGVSLIAIGTFYYILTHLRKKNVTKSFHQEYDEILTGEQYKVKGRFE